MAPALIISAAFPIQDDLQCGESGHGYALRMATANLLNGLPAVKELLGKSRFAVLGAEDAFWLSKWFGAERGRLEVALGRTGVGSERDEYELAGVALTRSYFVNRSQPRVCPQCLSAVGVCRSSWELTLATTCAFHSAVLRSECSACGKQLRWDRPHLRQCRCGWVLDLGKQEKSDALECDVAGWIEHGTGLAASWAPATLLGRMLEPLSLDAGMHVVWALASLVDRGSIVSSRPAEHRKKNSLATAKQLVRNAAASLEAIACGARPGAGLRVSGTTLELLSDAVSCNYSASDRQLAMSLLAVLTGRPAKMTWRSKFPQLAQLTLFPFDISH